LEEIPSLIEVPEVVERVTDSLTPINDDEGFLQTGV